MELCHTTSIRRKVEHMKRELVTLQGEAENAEAVLDAKKNQLKKTYSEYLEYLFQFQMPYKWKTKWMKMDSKW